MYTCHNLGAYSPQMQTEFLMLQYELQQSVILESFLHTRYALLCQMEVSAWDFSFAH